MNRIVLITGAKWGIGYGIAEAFSKKKYTIIMADVDEGGVKKSAQALKQKYHNDILPVKCDISSRQEVKQMIDFVQKKFGQLNVLVNNAGIYPFKPFNQLTEKDWDLVINVNLKGTYLVTKESLRIMGKGGKIVSISSIAAVIGFPAMTHYCASKAGIIGFTKALSLELASLKINVNAILPGAIETPGTKPMMNSELLKQTLAMIPWKRMGKPRDIANAVVFLSSDKADYITGQTLIVDGGYTVN